MCEDIDDAKVAAAVPDLKNVRLKLVREDDDLLIRVNQMVAKFDAG